MPSVQQPPLWVLGEATCLEKAATAPHAQQECPSNIRQQKPRATCFLAKYSGSHVLSSPIQSLIASTHSFNNKISEVPLYPDILPTWSSSHEAYSLVSTSL